MKPLVERLLARVERGDGCWKWLGTINNQGYGVFALYEAGVKVKTSGAHRLLYEQLRGPIPAQLTLDHLCRNRACVNPDHLEPVPFAVNVLRGEGPTARNARRETCEQGHPLTASSRGGRQCLTCAADRRAARVSMPDEQKPHGTANCYSNYACRREECRKAYDATRPRNRKVAA